MDDLIELRRRGERLLATLDLPQPLTVVSLATYLSAARGRQVVLRDLPASLGPSGLWIKGELRDYLYCDPHATGLHRTQIQAHEFAHMLWGHASRHSMVELYVQLLQAEISPDTVRMLLTRESYDDEEERAAEVLGSLLLQRMDTSGRESLNDAGDASVAQLNAALGRRERPAR